VEIGMTRLPIFASVADARAALNADGLGTVYRRSGSVFVVTAFGTGTFTAEQWDRHQVDEPVAEEQAERPQ
jgi:hypothetical protein